MLRTTATPISSSAHVSTEGTNAIGKASALAKSTRLWFKLAVEFDESIEAVSEYVLA